MEQSKSQEAKSRHISSQDDKEQRAQAFSSMISEAQEIGRKSREIFKRMKQEKLEEQRKQEEQKKQKK